MLYFILGGFTGIILFILMLMLFVNSKNRFDDDEKETIRNLIEQLNDDPVENKRIIDELFIMLER